MVNLFQDKTANHRQQIQMRLPRDFSYLSENERNSWREVKSIVENLSSLYRIIPTKNPFIKGFHLVNSKQNLKLFRSWQASDSSFNSFKLSLLKYDTAFRQVKYPYQEKEIIESHYYFLGQLSLRQDFGRVFIKPETIEDKIVELFSPVEIDFKSHPLFSFKYYVLTKDKEHFINKIPEQFFKLMENFRGVSIEFNKRQCVFKLPAAIDMEECNTLCKLGFGLDNILNNTNDASG